MNIQNVFTINVLYKLIIEFLDIEAINLRTICREWKNKYIICKSLYLALNTNIDPLIKKLPYIIYPKYLEQIEINLYKVNEMSAVNLETLSQFTNLKYIYLHNIFYISDKSMFFLANLNKLELLKLYDCYMTDDANVYITNDFNSRGQILYKNEKMNICQKCDKIMQKYMEEDNELVISHKLLCPKCLDEIQKYKGECHGYTFTTNNCHIMKDNPLDILKEFKQRNKPSYFLKACAKTRTTPPNKFLVAIVETTCVLIFFLILYISFYLCMKILY
jgi:hypothetical protein